MNKQEAIEKIKYMDTLNINDMVAGQQVDMVIKNQVLGIVSQIDEPQKVVVPKCIGDLIKELKIGGYALGEIGENVYDDEEQKWIDDNEELFYLAWLNGYEIEQEKLYTVEIPNPNIIGNEVSVLMKNVFKQIVMLKKFGVDWKNERGFQLTESEIKEDFDWAWQWAREVK